MAHHFRSTSFTTEEIRNLFGGFCPISGSPVRPSAWSKWGSIPFKKASNTAQTITGGVSVCCWPCVCDLQEFVKADTLEVDTRDGRTTFDVLVIGISIFHNLTNCKNYVRNAIFQATLVFNLRGYLDGLPKCGVSMEDWQGRPVLLTTTS